MTASQASSGLAGSGDRLTRASGLNQLAAIQDVRKKIKMKVASLPMQTLMFDNQLLLARRGGKTLLKIDWQQQFWPPQANNSG